MGESNAQLIEDNPAPVVKPFSDMYVVLEQKMLYFYADASRTDCIRKLTVPEYVITLSPDTISDHELYLLHNPIVLSRKDDAEYIPGNSHELYLYPQSSSEKESWFIILRRASKLPIFADDQAASAFYQDEEPVQQYVEAMEKLISSTLANEGYEQSSTAWLNALVGRMFVAIHANENVKNWVIQRLSRHTLGSEADSFLGDIVIQDMNVGNSLPVLSNPKLVQLSVDGDMLIEIDIDYTGGLRLEASTTATVSVESLVNI
jgi:hypothetical protein